MSSDLYSNANIRNTFFSELGTGILANTILLLFHIAMWARGHRPRPTDLPIGLLAFIHLLSLVTGGVIATDIFMSRRGWDDITCKSLFYLHRFFRGMSICVTCLLSVLQAVTLSPRGSCFTKFKHKLPVHHLGFLLLSALYISVTSHLIISIIATPNMTSDNLMYMTGSCSLLHVYSSVRHTFSTMLIFREACMIGLMAVSSVYMATLLCRHRKEFQYLHSTSLSPKASPELKATRTILLLLGFFVLMSTLDSFMSYSRNMLSDDPIFYCIQILVSHSYAAVSPWVFISTDKRITDFLRSICGRTGNI